MPGEALLIGIAQLAVVIAGFTAITSALAPRDGSWSPGQRIRQRAIVSTSFNVMFESLLPLVAYYALNDTRQALVLASAAVTLYVVFIVSVRARQFVRAGVFFRRGTLIMLTASVLAGSLFALNALALGSVAPYALGLSFQMSVAAISFYTLIAAASS